MNKFVLLPTLAVTGTLSFCFPSYADDHLLTAIEAGGVVATTHDSPGQGSPLSGEDHTTPASATVEDKFEENDTLRTNPAWDAGHVAPANK